MVRKSLFWGLTVILLVTFVSLILRGWRLEKQEAARAGEEVRQSFSSATRVLEPQDLKIEGSTMQLIHGSTAIHEVEIHNNGNIFYQQIQLQFVYLNQAGKVLSTREYSLDRSVIIPGQTFTAADIVNEEIPASTTKFRVSILYADVLPLIPAEGDSQKLLPVPVRPVIISGP